MLEIKRGYNKDGRPQCNQVVVGQIVNEEGIPIASKTMNGSTSDPEWNTQAVAYLQQMQSVGFQYGIFVADSKLVTHDLVTSMNAPENHVTFVSRCPAGFENKLEERTIHKAYENNQWSEPLSFQDRKDAVNYRMQPFSQEVCGATMRLLVMESSSLKKKAGESLEKILEEMKPAIKVLEHKCFRCEADVQEELVRFGKEKGLKLYECTYEIEKEEVEKWPRGRRGPNTKSAVEESWHIRVTEIKRKESECQKYLEKESCIIRISNSGPDYSDYELAKTYKGQQVVENSFKELKTPSVASVIYLKNPDRIEALSMLMTLSLLIRAIIQYRLREGLRKFDEKERQDEYSYAWPTTETRNRVEILLSLMGIELEELIK